MNKEKISLLIMIKLKNFFLKESNIIFYNHNMACDEPYEL